MYAVTDSQYRHAYLKNFLGHSRSVSKIHAIGTARKYDTLGVSFLYLFHWCFVRNNLAVYVVFSYSSGYKLIVLTAEVYYQNKLVIHFVYLSSHLFLYRKYILFYIFDNIYFLLTIKNGCDIIKTKI